jgi:hypothetical protein
MKLLLNYFASMTGGRVLGRRIYTRLGVLKVDTYNRFIQGFFPHYAALANEGADSNFRQKINPPLPLKLSPGVSVVRARSGSHPGIIIPNESAALGSVIYSTDLWHFYSDDPTETDLGIPNGTPASNAGIDAVIFNSKILTSHPSDGDLYHAPIAASPSWTGVGSFQTGVKPLHVIEDQCLVLDSSQGSGKPRDRVKLVQTDFSVIDGFAIGTSDFDIQDMADHQARFALLFARKTTSGSSAPNLSKETTVFLWDVVPGDSYDLKTTLPGTYCCSINKNGFVYAFTQIGTTLVCSAFDGTGFREVGRIANVSVDVSTLLIPRTRITLEGDFFVLLASSPGNTLASPLYWNPSNGEAFFLLSPIDSQPFTSLAFALNSAQSYTRYFGYSGTNGIGALYKCTLEANSGNEFTSDGYDASNQDGSFVLPGPSDTMSRAAQSFTAKGGKLLSASFYLEKEGSPTGTMVAKLYAHSGTFGSGGIPTGSALATSDTIDISTLTTNFGMVKFTFSGTNQIQLSVAQHYFVSFEYAAGNSSNRPHVGYDNSSPTHPGNSAIFDSATWTATTQDIIFLIAEGLPASAGYKSNIIAVPPAAGDPTGRGQIKRLEILYDSPPPTADDSIVVTMTTKDQYETNTFTDQTATIKDTTAHSTNANIDSTRAIIQLGAKATDFEIDLSVTATTPTWNPIIRDIVVVYDPIALQQ